MGAVLPTKLHGGSGMLIGPFILKTADTVDGLLYMEDSGDPGYCIVAAGNVLCGTPLKRAVVGEKVTLRVTGEMPAKCSGIIAVAAAVTPDSAGKCKTGTVGTDHIIGFLRGAATGADGDIFTLVKIA